MSRRYRTAVIGFAHPHVNHVAGLFTKDARVEWAACADTAPLCPELRVVPYAREWNRDNVMRLTGAPRLYDDYREMLDRERLDLVIVNCENAQHPDVVEACARAGASVCVEKPMASSLADALRMQRACRAAGVSLIVNWPVTWLAHARKAGELIEAGAIGRVLEIDYRVGSSGPFGPGAQHCGGVDRVAPMSGRERASVWLHQQAAGGGAMVDLCCYGAMYSCWFTGERATAALGLKANLESEWSDAEDNGVIVARFPRSILVARGSWTTHGKNYLAAGPVVVYGSEGVLRFDVYTDNPVVRVEHPGEEVETHAPDPLPEGRHNTAAEFLHCLETGVRPHLTLTPEFNLALLGVLDAGVRSAATGKLELVNDEAWSIG
jgi:predicted dehydrogenase